MVVLNGIVVWTLLSGQESIHKLKSQKVVFYCS